MAPESLFKRTPCKFWLAGRCEKGDLCTWSHGEDDEAAAAADEALLRQLTGDDCGEPGEEAKFAVHGNFKRTICKFWQENRCQRGEFCTFAHGQQELGEPIPEEAPLSANDTSTNDLSIAVTADVPNTVVKRTICKFWERNICTRGEFCTFAHGEEEVGITVTTAATVADAQQPPALGARLRNGPHYPDIPVGTGGGGGSLTSRARMPFGATMSALAVGAPWRQEQQQPLQQQQPRLHMETEVRRTICKFWLDGACSKASGQCTFAHGEHEIGTMPGLAQSPEPMVRRSISKLWQAGNHREALGHCTFAHGEHKIGTVAGMMLRSYPRGEAVRQQSFGAVRAPCGLGEESPRRTLCKFWQSGSCSKAAGQCTFAHGEHEIGTFPGQTMTLHHASIAAAPPAWGDEPDHQVRRTLCKFWQAGNCIKAPGQCSFAHGEQEIGTISHESRGERFALRSGMGGLQGAKRMRLS